MGRDLSRSTNKMESSNEECSELRRGPWTLEEDTLLIQYVSCHGEGHWNSLAKCSGLKRTGKSCRLRWLNYLKPDIKRGNLSPQEQLMILELHSKWGNRWSKIAQHLPGRTDNEIKNYWRTRVQKQARQLKIDSNSKRFLETLRHFWMPRLLEKVEQTSASSSLSSTSTIDTQKSTSFSPHDTFKTSSPQPSPVEKSMYSSDNTNGIFPSLQENSISQTSSSSVACVYENYTTTSSLPNDYYYVDNTSFDMIGPDMSAVGPNDTSSLNCQMAEPGWTSDDMASTFWDMDELWQLTRK